VTLLTNSFEGGTSGIQITTGNSGGTSGNAFDTATQGSGGTLDFDSSHAAHGLLSCKLATTTAATTFLQWAASFGSQATFWYRGYFYFTANPAATIRLFNCTTATGATSVMSLSLNLSGKLIVSYSGSGTSFVTFTASIPLNQWFRVEGLCVASATVGQVGASLYTSLDSLTPAETHTSAANLATGALSGTTSYSFGDSNGVGSVGPFWLDDIGLSSTGPLGPAYGLAPQQLPLSAVARAPAPRRARTGPAGALAGGTEGTLSPQGLPQNVVSPSWIRGQRQRVRAVWRAISGQPPPVAAAQPQQAVFQRRSPARAVWRGITGQPPPVTPSQQHPPRIPRRQPARAVWRSITGQPPQVQAAPKPPRPVSRQPSRAFWRGGAGPAAAPGQAAVRLPPAAWRGQKPRIRAVTGIRPPAGPPYIPPPPHYPWDAALQASRWAVFLGDARWGTSTGPPDQFCVFLGDARWACGPVSGSGLYTGSVYGTVYGATY
jgi:hypothetical protein